MGWCVTCKCAKQPRSHNCSGYVADSRNGSSVFRRAKQWMKTTMRRHGHMTSRLLPLMVPVLTRLRSVRLLSLDGSKRTALNNLLNSKRNRCGLVSIRCCINDCQVRHLRRLPAASSSERYAIFHRFAFRHRANESLNVIAHPQRDRYKPSSKSAADVVQSFPVPNLAKENKFPCRRELPHRQWQAALEWIEISTRTERVTLFCSCRADAAEKRKQT